MSGRLTRCMNIAGARRSTDTFGCAAITAGTAIGMCGFQGTTIDRLAHMLCGFATTGCIAAVAGCWWKVTGGKRCE